MKSVDWFLDCAHWSLNLVKFVQITAKSLDLFFVQQIQLSVGWKQLPARFQKILCIYKSPNAKVNRADKCQWEQTTWPGHFMLEAFVSKEMLFLHQLTFTCTGILPKPRHQGAQMLDFMPQEYFLFSFFTRGIPFGTQRIWMRMEWSPFHCATMDLPLRSKSWFVSISTCRPWEILWHDRQTGTKEPSSSAACALLFQSSYRARVCLCFWKSVLALLTVWWTRHNTQRKRWTVQCDRGVIWIFSVTQVVLVIVQFKLGQLLEFLWTWFVVFSSCT